MAEYTPEQKNEVDRIMKIKATDYYTILSVDKKADAIQIKKSYRKLAIKLHPDKNKHPQASEAFKKIAKAFEVLSDDTKRDIYDQTGGDPDSRMPSGGATAGSGAGPFGQAGPFGNGSNFFYTTSPFGGASGMGTGQGGAFEDDLFDMLFGGNNGFSFGFDGTGFRRTGFGNGNTFFYTNNGGPGLRRRQHAGARKHRREGQGRSSSETNAGQNAGRTGGPGSAGGSIWHLLSQYLPLLVFLIPVAFNLIAGSFSWDRTPDISFETSPAFSVERTSGNLGVKYYISQDALKDVNERSDAAATWGRLNNHAEEVYVERLRSHCRREQNTKEHMIEQSYGFFFVNEEKMKEAENYPMRNCDRLREMNLL